MDGVLDLLNYEKEFKKLEIKKILLIPALMYR